MPEYFIQFQQLIIAINAQFFIVFQFAFLKFIFVQLKLVFFQLFFQLKLLVEQLQPVIAQQQPGVTLQYVFVIVSGVAFHAWQHISVHPWQQFKFTGFLFFAQHQQRFFPVRQPVRWWR